MADTTQYDFGSPPPFGDSASAQMLEILAEPVQDPPMLKYRGAMLGQAFDMRKRMQISREKPMLGFWAGSFIYPNTLRMFGQAGYDFVLLDWEHTPMSIGDLGEHIRAVQYGSEGRTACIVRVPANSHEYITWCLDAGASGVILPHSETVEDAKKAVAAARFPKYGGTRSNPPNALDFGFSDKGGVYEIWNRAAVILQVESLAGADSADALAAVPGVDGLMVGPGDLALEMGMDFVSSWSNPRFLECITNISKAAKTHGKASLAPMFNTKAAAGLLAMGYTMTTTANDGISVSQMLRQNLRDAHSVLDEWKQSAAKQ